MKDGDLILDDWLEPLIEMSKDIPEEE